MGYVINNILQNIRTFNYIYIPSYNIPKKGKMGEIISINEAFTTLKKKGENK